MVEINKGLFYLISISTFLIDAISLFLFNRISVKHIEREMLKEGIDVPSWDKGIGMRFVMYAIVLVTNKVAPMSPVEDEAILRHGRNKDRVLALLTLVTSAVFLILMIAHYFLFGTDDL